MKKIVPILMIGILLLGGVTAIGIDNKNENSTIRISETFSRPIIQHTTLENNNFVEISMDQSLGTLHHVGEPLLPVNVNTFELPFGTRILDVSCDVNENPGLVLGIGVVDRGLGNEIQGWWCGIIDSEPVHRVVRSVVGAGGVVSRYVQHPGISYQGEVLER